ncbi:uncharacterized protein LOC127809981 isoform X2 [Diospyros lotus]|uniref:uncharacterized protein LOC127809981 isoform X2 n=1 Tax=Diospyros lotus TaxID=55363 RepID=UPI002259C7C6|nr:uncharacterized protein LOC127809981 isoform X2 [Diospyros lotus]
MADPHLLPDPPLQTQTPLLNNASEPKIEENPDPDFDIHLNKILQMLESYLNFMGFGQSSALSLALSWFTFFLIGVALPVAVVEFSGCSGCDKYQVKDFELDIVVSQACLAAASLLCLSHYLRKYGLRKFLFVDRYGGQMARFREQYIQKISECFRLLILWILPCFILKTAREVAHILYVPPCILFHLVCNLQIIHFDDYGKSFEREYDVIVFIEEHIRLRFHLSKISHRFRIYLVLVFLVVTASQFVTLLQTTGYSGQITLLNSSDFGISSIVQVVGIILCLNAAAKISHRAQGIASLASRWHAVATCSSADASQLRLPNIEGSFRAASTLDALYMNSSGSDLETLDHIMLPTNTQLASYMTSYHKRQALVMYLQTNPGGITIFGWTVDRGLISTIFFIELSLVLFLLGKTIVIASE